MHPIVTENKVLKQKLSELRQFAVNEANNIMSYWVNNAVDNKNGGFIGSINQENIPDYNAPKGLILNARLLWSFSVAYKIFKKPEYLDMTHRAYNYIDTYFKDNTNKGYYWMVDCKGNPKETKKQIYAQAFYMYGLSEYYAITGNKDALNKAVEIFELIEKYSFDPEMGGYFEAYSGEWGEIGDLRLSDKDMNEKKTMNTHLHILEAYSGLYKVHPFEQLKSKIEHLLDVFINKIISKKDDHFDLFFDENWTLKSDVISYGHDIEGTWLLLEAAEAINSEKYIKQLNEIVVKMTDGVLPAINKYGGLEHDRERNGHGDGEMEWWAQAESVVGFVNTYQVSGNEKYIDHALQIKDFILKYFVDKKYGEWFYRIDHNAQPIAGYEKTGFWKCPYHNSRMCFEVITRIAE